MTGRRVVVLRPEPGNAATVERVRLAGLDPVALPLFEISPVRSKAVDPARFDAVLLTSANAVRHGGAALGSVAALPVIAVGAATARAARDAGLQIAYEGDGDAQAAVAGAQELGYTRLLHLAGRDRTVAAGIAQTVTVYASDPLSIADVVLTGLSDRVALLHSPRAATVLGEQVDRVGVPRATIRLATLSRAVADAAGSGWRDIAVATSPNDPALIAAARTLAIDPPIGGADKTRMSDASPIDKPRRGLGLGVVVLVAIVALAIGVALMAYAMRASGRWSTSPAATAVAPPLVRPASTLAAQNAQAAAAAAVDPVTLATRESALAAQLASLEARTATLSVDATTASGQAGRAEAILIAFAARRTLDRGLPLGYLEDQLRQRFGTSQPRATMLVIQAARQPVTLQDLRQGLDGIAADLVAGNGGWLSGIGRELRTLIVIHKAGTPSPLPADRLARARRLLDAGQAEAALAEVSRLPGAAQAGNWTHAARRYILARQALDTIESAAILGQALPAAAPPPTG